MRNRKNKNEGIENIPATLKDPNHKRPVTRRDFLAHGMVGGLVTVATPSILSLLSKTALAQASGQCVKEAVSQGNNRIPVLMFDLAGGPNFAINNILAGGDGGQNDLFRTNADFRLFGLASRPNLDSADRSMGLAFRNDPAGTSSPSSGILRGINQALNRAFNSNTVTINRVKSSMDGVIMANISRDDTTVNQHNPIYWLAKAGANGTLSTLVGTSDTDSGARSQPVNGSRDPSLKPTVINSAQSVLNLVDPGLLFSLLANNYNNLKRVIQASRSMSSAALSRFEAQDLNTQTRTLIECGYLNGEELMSQDRIGPATMTNNTAITESFQLQGGANVLTNTSEVNKTAAITHMLLSGFAGAGAVELGGYDYHNRGRAATDQKDIDLGVLIGGAVAAAAKAQKSIAIYVFTDGAVAGNGQEFTADDGTKSAAFMMVYHHQNGPTVTRPGEGMLGGRRQIGSYTPGGVNLNAAQGTLIAQSTTNLGAVVVLNYLALHGQENMLDSVIGANPFTGSVRQQYIAFRKIV